MGSWKWRDETDGMRWDEREMVEGTFWRNFMLVKEMAFFGDDGANEFFFSFRLH